jgi:hypothetical protein
MSDGELQPEQPVSIPENVVEPGNRGGTSQATITDDNSASQEEKERVLERVEQEMDIFRRGECSRFQASARVLDELGKWSEATDEEKGKAFNSYLIEINSEAAIQNEDQAPEGETAKPLGASLLERRSKRVRDEVEDLLDQVSRGDLEGEESEQRSIRRRAREDEMPWYNPTSGSPRRTSCAETCKTLLQFSEDLSGIKSLLRVANNLPEGIPSSQWDRLLRGESVDLNQILSSMHFIQLDEERKGRLGTAEVVFAVSESKRQIKTGSEWSSAFRRMSKAVTFLFPHRREELLEYAEHIEGLFAAKQTHAHSKVILYDQSVRNQVGGGQNILLTDYRRFHSLSEAILHADGVEYRAGGKGSKGSGSGQDKGNSPKKDICRRFNGQGGCPFSDEDCYYKHLCKGCGKGGHGKISCTAERR